MTITSYVMVVRRHVITVTELRTVIRRARMTWAGSMMAITRSPANARAPSVNR
jgi:hypothetical protein